MSIETCENCQKQFHLIKNLMGYPVGKEYEKYWCPYCGHEDTDLIRGTFSTRKLEDEKLEDVKPEGE